MPIETYRDLETWQACMDVVVDMYQLTRKFPDHERFGLMSQMQRASVSMPSNVAEGWARSSTLVFPRMNSGAIWCRSIAPVSF
jgi:four helix bundle protein